MADNRFADMLKNVTEPSSPSVKSKRSPINFGASVERDARVVSTFQRLHQILPPGEPKDEPTNKPAIELTNEPDYKPTFESTKFDKSTNEPNYKPVRESANKSAFEPTNEPCSKPAIESDIKLTSESAIPIDPDLWFPFTEKQGRVLLYLIEAEGFANRNKIASDINVSVATVKYTLRILAKEGYIGDTRICMNPRQGFLYNINPQKCNEFYERIKGYSVNKPTHWPAHKPTQEISGQVAYNSSISSSSIKTNTSILSGSEMFYWEEAGLAERHAMAWCKEFDIPVEELRQQLAWARWDMVENRKEETVENPVNWLYGVFRRTGGCYPRPENYLSPIERRCRDMETEAKQREEARKRVRQIEIDLEFQKTMDDPDGDEYHQLYAQLTDYEKLQKGKILEMGLRRAFLASEETKP